VLKNDPPKIKKSPPNRRPGMSQAAQTPRSLGTALSCVSGRCGPTGCGSTTLPTELKPAQSSWPSLMSCPNRTADITFIDDIRTADQGGIPPRTARGTPQSPQRPAQLCKHQYQQSYPTHPATTKPHIESLFGHFKQEHSRLGHIRNASLP